MSSDIAISVKNVGKCYEMYAKPHHRLFQTFFHGRKQFYKEFWALQDISFEVKKGECIGIIGRNGCGKSTLLQIIAGTLQATTGSVEVNGRIAALLELGSGFNHEFTGRENVYMNGTVLGLTRQEIDEKFDDIVDFADIGEFIEQPVKTYSSGMFARLAFAVAINVNPDILIIDEALSVGDMFFQAKCITKMQEMIENNNITLIFVSHDINSIKAICKRGILLNKGSLYCDCDSVHIGEKYYELDTQYQASSVTQPAEEQGVLKDNEEDDLSRFFYGSEDFLKKSQFQRIQNGKAEFKNIVLLNEYDEPVNTVSYGQLIKLRMAIEVYEDIDLLCCGYHIRDHNGVDLVYSDCTIEDSHKMRNLKKGDKYYFDWIFNARLRAGSYHVLSDIYISFDLQTAKVDFCDLIPISAQFNVEKHEPTPLFGAVNWDNQIVIKKIN